jgi:hypothetical protein
MSLIKYTKEANSFKLVSPIVEIKVLNGFNFREVGEWCNASYIEEVVRGNRTEISMYVFTYDPIFGERGANNRLDFLKDDQEMLFVTYIAKLENGKFVLFDSITFDGALVPA